MKHVNWGKLNDNVKADFVEAIFKDDYDDNYFYSEATFVEVNNADVNDFINQLNLRKEKKGEFCIRGECVKSLYDCMSIFFGDPFEYDEYNGMPFAPVAFICSNSTVANKLYSVIKSIKYHDTFRQSWRDVILSDRYIFIDNGDY